MLYRLICAALAAVALCSCGSASLGVPPVLRLRHEGAALGTTGSGERWTYAGTIVWTVNGVTQRGRVAQTARIATLPDPYATPAGASDLQTVERDTFPNGSATYRTDSWQGDGAPLSGVRPELLYAVRQQDGAGDSYWARYPVPRILDRSPESDGASWTNGASAVSHESDRAGNTADVTTSADGSYRESVRYAYGCSLAPCSLAIAAAPNGGATFRGNALDRGGVSSITVDAPNARGIAVTMTFANGAKLRRTLPAWFAPGASLYAETETVRTGVTLPPSCHASPDFGTIADVITRNVARIDPAQGITETQQLQSFATPAYGTVCAILSDVTQVRYDLASLTFGARPLARSALFETLGLQSATSRRAVPLVAIQRLVPHVVGL